MNDIWDRLQTALRGERPPEADAAALPKVVAPLEALRAVPARSEARALAGLRVFLQDARSSPLPVSPTHGMRLTEWKFNLFGKELSPMKTVVTLTVIVALALGGTSATVSAAQNSLPEEALYAVKLASEAARLRLASDPQTQVNLLMEMAQTRTREMARMAELGKPVPPSVALRLEAHLRLALQTAAQLDETEMRAALKQLRQMAQAQTETLARVRQRHPEEAGLELAERVMTQMHDQAQSGLTEPALFRRQWQSGRPDDPPTQPAGAPNPSATPFSDQSPYRHDNGNDPTPNLTSLPGGHSYGPGPQITGTCTPQLDGNSYGPGPGTFSVTPTGDHNSHGPDPNPMPTPEGNHSGPPAGATPQPENTPPAGGPGGKP